MIFKHILILSATLAMSLATCSCGGDDDGNGGGAPAAPDAIKLSAETIAFTADGGSERITLTTPGEWDAVASASWLSLEKTGSLERKGEIVVKAAPNTATAARTATVTVLSGKARASVAVSQAGKAPAPVDPSIEAPEGYTLVWHDEFDGDRLDPADWRHEVKGPGWVNNERQHYVNGSFDGKPVTEVGDGTLKINCFKHSDGNVYSGRIYACVNSGWRYGVFEARLRLPRGKGTWPAFWMMPVDNDFAANPWPRCGEIDIMEEVGYNPNYTSSSIHCESYNHVAGTQRTAERLTPGAQDDFHVYRLEWTPDAIRTFVDGNPLLTFANDGRGNVSTWPFDRHFYIILNLAWGGDWGGAQGLDESCLPATMEVDYVRVFQK